jgi:hypothetical protein
MIDIVAEEAFERVQLILHGVPGGAEKAFYGIISRATTTIKTVSLEGITSVYDIKRKDIQDARNTAITTRTKKVDGGVIGFINYAGTKIPLFRFNVKPSSPKQGATVKARQRKDRGMTQFETAFVADMRAGRGIFERTTRARLPVSQIMGVSTAQMAADSGVMKKAEEAAQETIVTRTEHEISRILQGYGVR